MKFNSQEKSSELNRGLPGSEPAVKRDAQDEPCPLGHGDRLERTQEVEFSSMPESGNTRPLHLESVPVVFRSNSRPF